MTDQPKKGDYVLATKFDDGEGWDQWAVGFYDRGDVHPSSTPEHPRVRHYVIDSEGKQFRANGFRRCEVISRRLGDFLLREPLLLELTGAKLWDIVNDFRKHPPQARAPTPTHDETGSAL